MERNLDLIREMLITVSKSRNPVDVGVFVSEKTSRDEVVFNLRLAREAGLIEANVFYADNEVFDAEITRVTWEGFDYLETVKNDTVWKKTKAKIAQTIGSASLELVKKVASKVAEQIVMNSL